MAHFLWGSYLNTGHELIDDDHKKLVGMINSLYDVIEQRQGQRVMGQLLDNLKVYCQVHFRREEAEMRRIGYAGYEMHKHEHGSFISDVEQLKRSFDAGIPPNAVHVGKMLGDWLRNHIVNVDMQLAVALRDSQ